jgi:hypothetical protein
MQQLDQREILTEAVRALRGGHGQARGWLRLECPQTSCPVTEIRRKDGKKAQAPLRCARCGAELYLIDVER